MGEAKYEPLENLSLQKSNSLVSAKYKSSLIENQIMAIALTRIEANDNIDAPIQANLYPGELRRLLGDSSNIYRTLKKVSKTMTGHTMFLEDGQGNFKAFAVVNNADYIDGVFTVEFNKNLKNHIFGLDKIGNFTTFELSVLTEFKRNSSFRIYELLKSKIYKSKKNVNNGRVDVEYNISELRFMIGLANGDDPSVKNAMATMGNDIDWDVLYSKLEKKDRKYETWGDFQRYVIKVAAEELKEKSNIRFEYEGIKEGRRTTRIRFYIYPNVPTNVDIIDERKQFIEENAKNYRQLEIPKDIFPEIYEKYIGHNNLSKQDIDLLLKKSGNDAEKVEKAINLADKQPSINNYMGWLIHCIENEYYEVPTLSGSHEDAVKVAELKRDIEVNQEDIASKAWARTKAKEDFENFLFEIEKYGITLDVLESVYSKVEALQIYADWKVGRPMQF